MLEMNEEIRAQWCAALRSGEYEQAREALRSRDGAYCCLGVLTDLYVKAGNDSAYVWDNEILDDRVAEWAGLGSTNPVLSGTRHGTVERICASAWNDEEEADFSEIADMIDGGAE